MADYSKTSFEEVMETSKEILNSLGIKNKNECYFGCDKCENCPYKLELECIVEDIFTNIEKFLNVTMNFEIVVDWESVKIDELILVRDYKDDRWSTRHFAGYDEKNKIVYAWNNGYTSYTSDGDRSYWRYAKLFRKNEEE